MLEGLMTAVWKFPLLLSNWVTITMHLSFDIIEAYARPESFFIHLDWIRHVIFVPLPSEMLYSLLIFNFALNWHGCYKQNLRNSRQCMIWAWWHCRRPCDCWSCKLQFTLYDNLLPVAECELELQWQEWSLELRGRTKCWPAWETLGGGSGGTSSSLGCSVHPQSGTSWSSLLWMQRLYPSVWPVQCLAASHEGW